MQNSKFETGLSLGISKSISIYVFIETMIDRNQPSMLIIVFLEHIYIILPKQGGV